MDDGIVVNSCHGKRTGSNSVSGNGGSGGAPCSPSCMLGSAYEEGIANLRTRIHS